MKIKPILFSTPMVDAILKGRKTQTRRIIKSRHESGLFRIGQTKDGLITEETSLDWDERPKNDNCNDIKPIANIDDILWVRETWRWSDYLEDFCYKANSENPDLSKWKPSIFMPKEAARIFLKVTNVRAERLQDITQDDAKAEGLNPLLMSRLQLASQGQLYQNYLDNNKLFNDGLPPYWSFNSLWCKINGADSWDSNPWVWVYEFEKVERPANFLGESKEVE